MLQILMSWFWLNEMETKITQIGQQEQRPCLVTGQSVPHGGYQVSGASSCVYIYTILIASAIHRHTSLVHFSHMVNQLSFSYLSCYSRNNLKLQLCQCAIQGSGHFVTYGELLREGLWTKHVQTAIRLSWVLSRAPPPSSLKWSLLSLFSFSWFSTIHIAYDTQS